MEEAAAQAYDKYVKDGVDPVRRRVDTSTSQFKGVRFNKKCGNWRVECKGKNIGGVVQVEPSWSLCG
jgi:hypothetical protein